MLKTLGIIQACLESATVRDRVARRIHGKTVLARVARRVTECQCLDGVLVVIAGPVEGLSLAAQVPADVPVFAARQADALGSLLAALEQYPAEAVVSVRGDNPFVDPGLIDRLVAAAQSQPGLDYASYCSRDGRPAILSPVGVYAEWFRVDALRKAARGATSPADRREVTRHLYSHPETFRIRLLPAPSQIDRDDVRLSVEMPEDWDHALAILEALGSEEFDWQRIADLLDHQPSLRRRMADLNRAGAAR